MRIICIALVALLWTCRHLLAQGTLTLNADDTYVYQFSGLPLQSVTSFPGTTVNLSSNFQLGSFSTNGAFLAEMFENSASDEPIASQMLVYDQSLAVPAPPGVLLSSPDAWQDLQGAVKFTMLSGSVTITQFSVKTVLPDPGGFAIHWINVQPVPEPNSFALIGVGFAMLWVKSCKRKYDSITLRLRDFAPLR